MNRFCKNQRLYAGTRSVCNRYIKEQNRKRLFHNRFNASFTSCVKHKIKYQYSLTFNFVVSPRIELGFKV